MNANAWAVAAAAALVVACSGGSGRGTQLGTAREGAPSQHEPVPGGREAAGDTRDAPSPTQGGATPTPSGACVRCDVIDACTFLDPSGKESTGAITLVTKNGECTVQGSGEVLHCDGTVGAVQGATGVVRWTPYGNGGFQVVTSGVSLRCSPE